jgi:hypothetical protein
MAKVGRQLKPVQIGNISIPLYRLGDGRIAFSDRFGGPRRVRKFRSEEQARAEAERIAIQAMNGQAVRHELSAADVQIYHRVRTELEAVGMDVSSAIAEYVSVKKLAGGRDLLPLVREGMKQQEVPAITVNGIFSEMIARKERLGRKYWRMKELKAVGRKLAEAGFGNRVISTVQTSELDEYLDSLKVGARRRNNVRSCIVTAWRYAKTKGYLQEPLGETAAEKTDRAHEESSVITVATPAEMKWWLENINETFLPWLAAIAFAGVRSEEICPEKQNEKDALRWDDFRWTKNYVLIRPEVSKVGEKRMCPLLPNLVSWLAPYKDRTGYVCPPGARPDNEIRRLNRLSAKLTREGVHPVPGLRWRHNIHRHSYGSYRMAIIKNMPQLEYEMGNSRDMIKSHYHDAREEDVAVEYFNIYRGEKPANIVEFTTAEQWLELFQNCSRNGAIAR